MIGCLLRTTIAWKLLSAHRAGHVVLTKRKIINKVFANFFWNTIHITSWKVHNPGRLWPQQFQLSGVTISITALKILEMYLWGVYLNPFEKLAPSKIFLNRLGQICRTHQKNTSRWLLLRSVVSFQLVPVFSFFIFS